MRLFNFIASAVLIATLLLPRFAVADPEVIELRGGQRLEGEILKETTEELFIDVGVDVVRVPLDDILSRRGASEADHTILEQESDIYRIADQPVRRIQELVNDFGEGVVLVETSSGLGSGFIINDRGYCVTNYHVVERETRITVTIFDRTEEGDFQRRRIEDVRILALNPFFDLALLQIPTQENYEFTPTYLARDWELEQGEDVFAVGNPLGLERSVSQGIVSTTNRNFDGIVYIQTTAHINPGNSGGPLFNSRGEVVGVTNMKLLETEGLGFAIPISYVKHFLENRDAFAFDENNPNTGFRYPDPPRRSNFGPLPTPE